MKRTTLHPGAVIVAKVDERATTIRVVKLHPNRRIDFILLRTGEKCSGRVEENRAVSRSLAILSRKANG